MSLFLIYTFLSLSIFKVIFLSSVRRLLHTIMEQPRRSFGPRQRRSTGPVGDHHWTTLPVSFPLMTPPAMMVWLLCLTSHDGKVHTQFLMAYFFLTLGNQVDITVHQPILIDVIVINALFFFTSIKWKTEVFTWVTSSEMRAQEVVFVERSDSFFPFWGRNQRW